MAFDACVMRAVLTEFWTDFNEAKIEKVLQPRNDEIDMVIHRNHKSKRLVFNVGPNAPRLQLSDTVKENPLKAPMLCMFLRKHFTGGRIISAQQPAFDRIAVFTVSVYDDMGYLSEKKIVCEIMGKYANFIVLDENDKIITAMKIIDFSASSIRQVLPGLKYELPKMADKLSPLVIDSEAFDKKYSEFSEEKTLEKFITTNYSGIATQIAHEIVYRATGNIDVPLYMADKERFYQAFSEWQKLLIEERYTPTVVYDKEGKPIDYSYMDITYLTGLEKKSFDTLADMFDEYFSEKDRILRIHQRAHDLITILNNSIARINRKLEIQRAALKDSEMGESYKKYGDLITANLYQLKRGMDSFETVDYYDPLCPKIVIKLNPLLHPSQNAQKMYKQYNKCKTAKEVLTEQISLWEKELLYLESVRVFLDRAQSEEDLTEIREELYKSGYASKMKDYRPQKKMKLRPHRYRTDGGFDVLVGRNNIQNDNLTFKIADKNDIWFHTKDIPGSHVILITDGKEPGDIDYTQAAALAARHSKATGDHVAVDYTRVKNIKKPQGAKPGFVIYKTNYTAYVDPADAVKEEYNG